MAQLTEITLVLEVNIPVEVKPLVENGKLMAQCKCKMKKAFRFSRKIGKLCRRYGYKMLLEDSRDDLQDLCDRQQES